MSMFQCYLNRKKLVNTGAEKKKKRKKRQQYVAEGKNIWVGEGPEWVVSIPPCLGFKFLVQAVATVLHAGDLVSEMR